VIEYHGTSFTSIQLHTKKIQRTQYGLLEGIIDQCIDDNNDVTLDADQQRS
jgi:hypothetical protein